MKQMKQLVAVFVLVSVPLLAYSLRTPQCMGPILIGLEDSNARWYIAEPVLYHRWFIESTANWNISLNPDWVQTVLDELYPFTCEENKMWNNLSKYKVPDQVEINPIEGVVIRNVTAFDVFSEENKRWTAKQVGLDYDSVKYGFSFRDALKKENEFVTINNLMIIEASLTVHLYNVTMDKTKFDLSYDFDKYCNISKTRKTLQDYGRIIDFCKTHYFANVILGGRLWFRVFVSIDAYKADPDNMKQLAVNELERYFRINTTQSGKVEFPGEVGREYFQLGATTPSKLCDNYLCDYSYWLKHLPEDPYIVGGKMKPIFELTEDEDEKSQFENAIKLYLAGDYISEMINLLDEIESPKMESKVRQDLRNVIGYYDMFGDSNSLKQQIKKWEIPFTVLDFEDYFINATDDELEFVGEKVRKIFEFRQIVGDNYPNRPCGHYMSDILDQCIEAVQHKWKSLNAFQITEPCCALYDLWNCALQSNCSVCAQDEIDKYQAFMVDAVSKSLCSTVPYHKYDQLCRLDANNTKVDFKLICPTKLLTEIYPLYSTNATTSSTSKSTSTWLIVMLVLNIFLIIAIVGTLLYICYLYFWIYKPLKAINSPDEIDDTKKASKKQVTSSVPQVNSKQAKSQVKSNLKETKSIVKGQGFSSKTSL